MKLFRKSKSYNWKSEHQKLWEAHVPDSGSADTIQGELVRIVGKLVDQAYRNGNCNWDSDHVTMWRFIATKITNDKTFSNKEKNLIHNTVEEIIRDEACPDLSGDGSTYYTVNEKVIDWCIAHPEPISFEPDGSYSR